jgi:signal transduction histidine kinase
MFRKHAGLFAAAVAVTPLVAAAYQSGPPPRTAAGELSTRPPIVRLSADDPTRPLVRSPAEGAGDVASREVGFPSGSTVELPHPSLWRDHPSTMIAIVAIVLTQAVLIGGLVVEHRRRRHAEGEARRHLAAMAHLNRRHAIGELTASLAHELSQPLTAILRNAETAKMLLATSPFPADDLRDIVEDIRKDDKRACEVIRRLHALLAHHEPAHEPLDVNEVARETAAIVAPDADYKGVRVHLDLAAVPGIVAGDRVHLQQVLLNLMLNSIEAMGAMAPERRRLVVRTASHNGSVSVLVNDTGPGLGANEAPRIFEAFYTTKGGGMGMGLSIARSIVEAHGGAIEGGNNPEGGATMRFTLPAQRAS